MVTKAAHEISFFCECQISGRGTILSITLQFGDCSSASKLRVCSSWFQMRRSWWKVWAAALPSAWLHRAQSIWDQMGVLECQRGLKEKWKQTTKQTQIFDVKYYTNRIIQKPYFLTCNFSLKWGAWEAPSYVLEDLALKFFALILTTCVPEHTAASVFAMGMYFVDECSRGCRKDIWLSSQIPTEYAQALPSPPRFAVFTSRGSCQFSAPVGQDHCVEWLTSPR